MQNNLRIKIFLSAVAFVFCMLIINPAKATGASDSHEWLGLIDNKYLITIVMDESSEPYYFYNKYGKKIELQRLRLQNNGIRLYEDDNTYFEGKIDNNDYFEGSWFNNDKTPLKFFAFKNPQGVYGSEIKTIENNYDACQEKDPSTTGIVECTGFLLNDYKAEINNYMLRLKDVLTTKEYVKINHEQNEWLNYELREQREMIIDKYKNEEGSIFRIIIPSKIAGLYEDRLLYLRRVYETNLLLRLQAEKLR